MKEKICFYCQKNYLKDTEHVFPDGLGGEKVYMDCVCVNCNNEFSKLERELYQKGIPALIRSVEGVSSYKQKNKINYFKAQALLVLDEKNKIVYEVNQNDKFKISLKSQVLRIGGRFYIEGSDQKDMDRLIKLFRNWKRENQKLIIPAIKNKKTSGIQFKKDEERIRYEETELERNENKAIVFEVIEDHELTKYLEPRIYLSADYSLKLRATSKDEAVMFLKDFLEYTLNPVSLRSFSRELNDNGIVYVLQKFDGLKSERALVKIALNCLLHYFPDLRDNRRLEDARLFVKEGDGKVSRSLVQSNNLIDSKEKCHSVFFYQLSNELSIRLSLFKGQFCYQIILPGLRVFDDDNNYSRMTIDYVARKNNFERRADFLAM